MNLRNAALSVALVAVAGCSGGGGGQAAAPIPSASIAPVQSVKAAVTFSFPVSVKSASASGPRFVSPGAANFIATIQSYNGIAPANFPSWLTPTTSVPLVVTPAAGANCAIPIPSEEKCTVTIPTYPGKIIYEFSLTDSSNHVLSSYTGRFVITEGQQNSLSFTFFGAPATAVISLIDTPLHSHRAYDAPISVGAYDASGSLISTSPYANPITLTDNDTSGATSLGLYNNTGSSSVVIPNASTPVKLHYSGLAILPFTLTATASGMTTATLQVTPVLDPIYIYGAVTDTLSSSDPNYEQPTVFIDTLAPATQPFFYPYQYGWSYTPFTNNFTVTPVQGIGQSGSCATDYATVSSSDGLTFDVTPKAAGFAEYTITGGAGVTNTVWISITTASIGINSKHSSRKPNGQC